MSCHFPVLGDNIRKSLRIIVLSKVCEFGVILQPSG